MPHIIVKMEGPRYARVNFCECEFLGPGVIFITYVISVINVRIKLFPFLSTGTACSLLITSVLCLTVVKSFYIETSRL